MEVDEESERVRAFVVPAWLVIALGVLFAFWLLASIVILWRSQLAISHTTLLCTDRLIAEVDIRSSTQNELGTLRSSNRRLLGRVEAYEKMFSLAGGRTTGDTGVGGENND